MSETLTEPRTVTATRTVTTAEVIERMRLATVARVPAKPWRDTGRWQSLPCRGCGAACDPSRRWCEVCSGVLS